MKADLSILELKRAKCPFSSWTTIRVGKTRKQFGSETGSEKFRVRFRVRVFRVRQLRVQKFFLAKKIIFFVIFLQIFQQKMFVWLMKCVAKSSQFEKSVITSVFMFEQKSRTKIEPILDANTNPQVRVSKSFGSGSKCGSQNLSGPGPNAGLARTRLFFGSGSELRVRVCQPCKFCEETRGVSPPIC